MSYSIGAIVELKSGGDYIISDVKASSYNGSQAAWYTGIRLSDSKRHQWAFWTDTIIDVKGLAGVTFTWNGLRVPMTAEVKK